MPVDRSLMHKNFTPPSRWSTAMAKPECCGGELATTGSTEIPEKFMGNRFTPRRVIGVQ